MIRIGKTIGLGSVAGKSDHTLCKDGEKSLSRYHLEELEDKGLEIRKGMAEQPVSVADEAACHVKQCSQQASYSCEHCGRAYCSEHIRRVSIERRQVRAHEDGGLARLPTRTETYWLCPSCWNKPVPGKQPLLP